MSLKSDTYCLQSNLIVKGPCEVSRPKMALANVSWEVHQRSILAHLGGTLDWARGRHQGSSLLVFIPLDPFWWVSYGFMIVSCDAKRHSALLCRCLELRIRAGI